MVQARSSLEPMASVGEADAPGETHPSKVAATEELDVDNSDVCTKYREAANIANLALQGIVLQVDLFRVTETHRLMVQTFFRLVLVPVLLTFASLETASSSKKQRVSTKRKPVAARVLVATCSSALSCITQVKGKLIEKGVAFPTCISINECVCHNCPLETDPGI